MKMYAMERRDVGGFGGFGEFGGILDEASAAVARGIRDGVTSALPQVQSAIQGVVRDVLPIVRTAIINDVLPPVQTRLISAIRDGLTQGAEIAKTELASTTSDLLPALQDSVVKGGTKIVDKYKAYLIAGGLVGLVAMGTIIFLQYEQVRLLKKGR